jgi:signal transduction histidine kinase
MSKVFDDPTGIQTIITIHDETKNRELETMKVDFVSMAAHELRTPLTAISGYIGLMKNELKPSVASQKQKQYLERAEISAGQLAGLINNLLNVARIERGALNMHLDKLNWPDMVKNLVNDQLFSAKQKQIDISYIGTDDVLFVLGDEVALSEVVNNLISNAIHYSPNGSSIVVNVKRTSEGLQTSIADNGVGIPPQAQAHLFTKFFRVHGGLAMGSGGTGLGLFISKSIVELHHGRIWVESKEGQGSTFFFVLPLFDQKRYDEIDKQTLNLKKKHGWVTKNITR